MIRINLLPAELQRGNRLSAKVLVAAIGAAVAVSAAVGWFGIVYFGDLGAAEEKLRRVEATLTERSKLATYHDQLESNKQDYASRVQTIQDIAKSRRLWTKFCDELIDVVNNNGDTDRHLAWFTSIAVKSDVKGATVNMPGFVQDADKSRLANFHEDLERAPFAPLLLSKSDPVFKLEMDKDRVPAASLSFPMNLQFKPTIEKTKGGK